jgi:hypothetical protein
MKGHCKDHARFGADCLHCQIADLEAQRTEYERVFNKNAATAQEIQDRHKSEITELKKQLDDTRIRAEQAEQTIAGLRDDVRVEKKECSSLHSFLIDVAERCGFDNSDDLAENRLMWAVRPGSTDKMPIEIELRKAKEAMEAAIDAGISLLADQAQMIEFINEVSFFAQAPSRFDETANDLRRTGKRLLPRWRRNQQLGVATNGGEYLLAIVKAACAFRTVRSAMTKLCALSTYGDRDANHIVGTALLAVDQEFCAAIKKWENPES